MALTNFCPAAIIRRALDKHGIPQETWAGIVSASTGMVSEYLSGKRPLPNVLGEEWVRTIKVVEELIRRSNPLPLNFHPRCADRFKKILTDFDKRLLLVSVVDLSHGSKVTDEVAHAASVLADAMSVLSGTPMNQPELEKTEEPNVAAD